MEELLNVDLWNDSSASLLAVSVLDTDMVPAAAEPSLWFWNDLSVLSFVACSICAGH